MTKKEKTQEEVDAYLDKRNKVIAWLIISALALSIPYNLYKYHVQRTKHLQSPLSEKDIRELPPCIKKYAVESISNGVLFTQKMRSDAKKQCQVETPTKAIEPLEQQRNALVDITPESRNSGSFAPYVIEVKR